MRIYPHIKECVVCHKTFQTFNRYQAARNKTCSKECCSIVIAKSNSKRSGWHLPKEAIFALKQRIGVKNPNWKGDKVSYSALHSYVRTKKLKPSVCMFCKSNRPIDIANISGNYLRDLDDWEWLCRRCHMIKDGRIKNLKQFNKDTRQNRKESLCK